MRTVALSVGTSRGHASWAATALGASKKAKGTRRHIATVNAFDITASMKVRVLYTRPTAQGFQGYSEDYSPPAHAPSRVSTIKTSLTDSG